MRHSALLLQVVPSSGEPIYRQLIEQIKRMISSGKLKSEDYLPSVRQLAAELDVNPMTISKAYSLLEAQNIVTRVRGKGMKVMEYSHEATTEERLEQLIPIMETLIHQSQQLDLEKEQVVEWFNYQIEKEVQ